MKKKSFWIACCMLAALTAVLLTVLLWPKPDETDIVGICYREGNSKENAAYRETLEKALKARGYTLKVTDADSDQAKQLTQIEYLAEQGCDLLVVEPVMTDGAKELLTALDQTGVPAVLFNRQLDTNLIEGYPQVFYIGYDDSFLVEQQADMLKSMADGGDINGDGIVSCILLMGSADQALSEQYGSYFADEPGFQVLLAQNSEGTPESGRKLCKEGLATYGKDIEVILCANNQIASGAVEAITDGGRTVGKDVYLFGIGVQKDDLTMIQDGKLSGMVYRSKDIQIQAVVETVHAKLQEQPVENIQILLDTPITAEDEKE